MDVKGNKKNIYCYTSTKRLSKEPVGSLLHGSSDLRVDRLRIRYSMFSLPQPSTIRSPGPLCLVKTQGKKVPTVDGDLTYTNLWDQIRHIEGC